MWASYSRLVPQEYKRQGLLPACELHGCFHSCIRGPSSVVLACFSVAHPSYFLLGEFVHCSQGYVRLVALSLTSHQRCLRKPRQRAPSLAFVLVGSYTFSLTH